MSPIKQMRLLLAVAAAAILAACASIGRPEGGPRDMTPPRFVRSNPMPGQTDVKVRKVNLWFDENITLDDPTNKIVVSPPQAQQPIISSNGHRVSIEMRDPLVDSVTYTIDFADAIRDLNEANVLDGFALAFSTGDFVDSLSISGMVFEARTLEPAQGMVVGVYSSMTDTTLTHTPLERVTKTNQAGQFTLRNLRPGAYRIFAINDVNRDFRWDRSEDIAFLDVDIVPTTEDVWVPDTIAPDSIVSRRRTRFLPDNLLLTWFNEEYTPAYLVKNERPERNKIHLEFSRAADSLARMTVVGGPLDGRSIASLGVLDATAGRDTITWWLTDTIALATDSLRMSVSYLKTDSLDALTMHTDTLNFFLRARRDKKKNKSGAGEAADSAAMQFTALTLDVGQLQELNRGIYLTAVSPLARIDSLAFRMEKMVDTLWTAAEPPRLRRRQDLNPREYVLEYDWEPSTRYRLTLDSATVVDIYGLHNQPLSREFTTRAPEDYSALFFSVSGLEGRPAVVELLRSDNPVALAPVGPDGVASFFYLQPATYYARLFIDSNGNGRWDTGNVGLAQQPEDVYYYPKKLTLKKNWDVEQTWNIDELPVDLQKPLDIKKNKPKRKKWEDEPSKTTDADADDYDEWGGMNSDPWSAPGLGRNPGSLNRPGGAFPRR